ncbi:type II toxin-antitoxin system prevent-host-death family antitoxin [Jeotgalibacillus malaysiensis]|uniref:type II toxin-antitoxin system prevent-host-death family antitoxin n=1 Tax=Jeotgalibacillus malaysiensis TaxID=1508404 RepID=UPI00384F8038
MPNIKPVSDLRNYNDVLKDISEGAPVFLTKNGRGRFAIVDINEYEKNQATIKLLTELLKAEKSVEKDNSWISGEDIKKELGLNE